jgi:hypothetical protein
MAAAVLGDPLGLTRHLPSLPVEHVSLDLAHGPVLAPVTSSMIASGRSLE